MLPERCSKQTVLKKLLDWPATTSFIKLSGKLALLADLTLTTLLMLSYFVVKVLLSLNHSAFKAELMLKEFKGRIDTGQILVYIVV